jgi:ABC-type transport system involved in multi-copper enzyme maturation permease subunit
MNGVVEAKARWSWDNPLPTRAWTKEVRALAPAWFIALVLPTLCGVVSGGEWEAAWVGFFMGCGLLGAIGIGHEYDHQTMGLLLSQPVDRRFVWGVKMIVLWGGMLSIALIYAPFLLASGLNRGEHGVEEVVRIIGAGCAAMLSGFCGAPLIALWVRSTLAAAVFATATPLMLWLLGMAIRYLRFGEEHFDSEGARLFFIRYGLAAIVLYCVLGLTAHYRWFTRLQAVERQGQGITLPSWLRRFSSSQAGEAPVVRRPFQGPSWRPMVGKELRLQTTALLLGALFAGGFVLAACVFKPGTGEFWRHEDEIWIYLYQAVVLILIGAGSCAEERRLGVLPGQLVLPRDTMVQWWVKVGVVAAIGVGLAFVMPAVCLHLLPGEQGLTWEADWWKAMVESNGAAACLCLLGLATYASSFAATSLKAFLWTLALALGVWVVAVVAGAGASATAASLVLLARTGSWDLHYGYGLMMAAWPTVALANACLTVAAMALVAGGWNYRNLGPQPARWLRQLLLIVGLPLLLTLMTAAAVIIFRGEPPVLESGLSPAAHPVTIRWTC